MKSFTLNITTVHTLRRKLLRWYRQYGRTLPWRNTHDPYRIMVSEIMLQQTQVDRVIKKYTAWLQKFPTVQDLAAATPKAVLAEWSGLGYNRRALALHEAAQQITHEYNGVFPTTVDELMKLKGIGKYTASAICAFAFKTPTPIVDTNVKRVLGRIFFGYKTLARYRDTDEPFWELKQRVLPQSKNAYDFNQGIMDFGAMICTAKKPACAQCPMQNICASYPEILDAKADDLRVKTKRIEPTYYGQPRRIWRGKILKALHATSKPATITWIGQQIQADWNTSRITWLQDVLETLEKDGMVNIRREKNWKVELPGASTTIKP